MPNLGFPTRVLLVFGKNPSLLESGIRVLLKNSLLATSVTRTRVLRLPSRKVVTKVRKFCFLRILTRMINGSRGISLI